MMEDISHVPVPSIHTPPAQGSPTTKSLREESIDAISKGALGKSSGLGADLSTHSASKHALGESIEIEVHGKKLTISKDPKGIAKARAELQTEKKKERDAVILEHRTKLARSINSKLSAAAREDNTQEENKKLRGEIEKLNIELKGFKEGIYPPELGKKLKAIDVKYQKALKQLGSVEYRPLKTSNAEVTLTPKLSPKLPKYRKETEKTYDSVTHGLYLSDHGTLMYDKGGKVHDTGISPDGLKQMIETAHKVGGTVKVTIASASREDTNESFYIKVKKDGSIKKFVQVSGYMTKGGGGVISHAFDMLGKTFDILKEPIPKAEDEEKWMQTTLEAINIQHVNPDNNEPGLVALPKNVFWMSQKDDPTGPKVAVLHVHRYDGELVKNIDTLAQMDPEKKMQAMRDLFHGARILDEKDVCHADIKGANIFTEGEKLCIADFDGVFRFDPTTLYSPTLPPGSKAQDKEAIAFITPGVSLSTMAQASMATISCGLDRIRTRLSGKEERLLDPTDNGTGLGLGLSAEQIAELRRVKELTIEGVGKLILTSGDKMPLKCILEPTTAYKEQMEHEYRELMDAFKQLVTENHSTAVARAALTLITGEFLTREAKKDGEEFIPQIGTPDEIDWDSIDKNISAQIAGGRISSEQGDVYRDLIEKVIKPALAPYPTIDGRGDLTNLNTVLTHVREVKRPNSEECERLLEELLTSPELQGGLDLEHMSLEETDTSAKGEAHATSEDSEDSELSEEESV